MQRTFNRVPIEVAAALPARLTRGSRSPSIGAPSSTEVLKRLLPDRNSPLPIPLKMSSKVLFLLLSFLALASGKTASRTAVRQGAASNVPSRYMLVTATETNQSPAAKKEAEASSI